MMPQIMGHVEMASQRLEAPLTAFRIDGSDQIEIACSVLVCKDKCPQKVGLIRDVYNSCISFTTSESLFLFRHCSLFKCNENQDTQVHEKLHSKTQHFKYRLYDLRYSVDSVLLENERKIL